ncbi:zinc finger CCCH domain-containing protein 3 isoform X2 [Sceloporus undulatus]|uniref:zinc finger CCCH domain-containing protein 3 isoform X2 n=1 Tax=Sceloporus undulatus TaxID=8520 RepID=UPI001C4C6F0B|nr:zinc finger CCCH domain-containing protein 3 isoform X2 [Sceloporus undulatus]
MEEKEQLRRQIRLLQGLINDHKNVHGNAPVPPPATRWMNPRPAFTNPGGFSAQYSQQTQRDFPPCQTTASAWRNKYSLVNIPPRPTLSSGSSVSASASRTTLSHASSEAPEPQQMLSQRNRGPKVDSDIVWVQGALAAGSTSVPKFQWGSSAALGAPAASQGSVSSSTSSSKVDSKERKEQPYLLDSKTIARNRDGGDAPTVSQKAPVTEKAVQGVSQLAPSLCRTISENAVTLKSEPQQPLTASDHDSGYLPKRKTPASQLPSLHSSQQLPAMKGKLNPSIVCTKSAWEASSMVGKALSEKKHTVPAVQKPPALPSSIKSPRFRKANYTWVANPSKSPQTVKKTSENVRKVPVSSGAAAKQPRGDLGAKQKKSGLNSKLGISSSQYKWKASSLQSPPSTLASAFTWRRKGCDGAGVSPHVGASTSLQTVRRVPLGHGNPRPFFGNTGFYKLKSRTKIIRRKGNACSLTEKRNVGFSTMVLKSCYTLRKKNSPRGRSSPTGRRSGTKGLIQIGKHRLRRLPASRTHALAKEGSSFLLLANSTANKVVNTRYRIVKKTTASPSSSAASFSSSAHSWRTRRLSASRSLVPNSTRHSPMESKSQALQQRWRNKSLRRIGGIMYRVSANKIAKTSSSPARIGEIPGRSHTRAGRLDSANSSFSYFSPSCPSRSTPSRYIASRAVQRSLAIIRQAKQKKEKKKEYCMYYNRFGKCNRGENCPYIHDPEKVAVCTRFLRGTCKKTDGSCPFSHKVSKEKMPVCSYFLKGICNNSDCPYSHVYVSRKAEVCSDFLKGYCPLGEKCKKKHTLVCPDFSKHGICPKGSQCKLQHPQRKHAAGQPRTKDAFKRESSEPKWGHPASRTTRKEEEKEEEEEEIAGPSRSDQEANAWHPWSFSQTSKLAKLPSFISLQSPPTSPDEEDQKPEKDRHGEEPGKPLQIKPRL